MQAIKLLYGRWVLSPAIRVKDVGMTPVAFTQTVQAPTKSVHEVRTPFLFWVAVTHAGRLGCDGHAFRVHRIPCMERHLCYGSGEP